MRQDVGDRKSKRRSEQRISIRGALNISMQGGSQANSLRRTSRIEAVDVDLEQLSRSNRLAPLWTTMWAEAVE